MVIENCFKVAQEIIQAFRENKSTDKLFIKLEEETLRVMAIFERALSELTRTS